MARPLADYTALEIINYPENPLVRAYNPGDDVPAGAVENWGLEVGVQVTPARRGLLPRPDKNAKRAEWETYAIHEGVPLDEAKELTRDELIAAVPEREDGDGLADSKLLAAEVEPEPVVGRDVYAKVGEKGQVDYIPYPAPTDKKEVWVAWVVEHRGVDEEEAKGKTRADLIAGYGPDPKKS